MFCAHKLMSSSADLVTVLLNSVISIFWILISSAELMLYGSFSESLPNQRSAVKQRVCSNSL